ncbi:hypothetical protein BC939DRAFT_72868 [Gamsiella multidivaricata]|uniref:uncharacterized protein n=1 Tax=Gamsiella multidivaricata TaxID=101098 RepID=UPI00221EFFF6|nr:uncharacterized protein BC939DRAFT_72868 [Gamsiella multidivaricata]KAI7815976.1 hypothetical protein BC939DRAFT_72868 [Gamsiella multidivaricata]
MTASEDGNTVVVYGGRIDLNTTHNPPTNFTGTFYTLDITTGKWSQGPDGGVRLYMACTIVGNQFVAWGGSGGSSTIVGPPVVFDLSLRKWVESYTAPAYYLSTSISATTSGLVPTGAVSSLPDGSKDSSSSSNLGAILGGVFGGLLVIALSGLIYLYLKRKEDRVRYGPPSNQQSAGSSEKADEPASTLQSQYSNGPASMNPQHVQFLRDPQDTSSFAQGPPGQVIFSSPIDSELEYCVSRKEAIPSPMFSSALGTAQPPTPIVYVPQTSYIPVTATGAPLGVFPPAPYTPTQDSSMMAPNSDIYRVHSIPPMTAATHNSNHFAGIISPVPTQAFNGYSAPLYAATDPTPFSNGTGYSSNYYSAPVASAIPPTIINASQQVYHPDNIRYPIPTNSAHDASAGGSDSIDTTIQPTSGMTVSSNGSNL